MTYKIIRKRFDSLSEDETLVELDDGSKVAVSIDLTWQPNNSGILLTGKARCLCDDGSPEICSKGQDIITCFTQHVEFNTAEEIDIVALVKEISRDMLLTLLGEPTTRKRSIKFLQNVSIREAKKLGKLSNISVKELI